MAANDTSIPTASWHGQLGDPRWTVMDNYALSHYHPKDRDNTAALEYALSAASSAGLPAHETFPAFAKYLAMQCKLLKVKHVLEIGCLGAYTGIWLTTMNPGLKVTTIEINPHHAQVAKAILEKVGLSDRVEVLLGSAHEVLPKLAEEIKAGTRPRFGLTYIDADKESNCAYFEWGLQLSEAGASIYVDNVVRHGRTIGEAFKDEPSVQGSRAVIEMAGKDPRVESVVVQTVCAKGYDGFLWALIKDGLESS